MGFLEELKRRKVFKVGVGYLVVAWLVVQVASIGFPTFEAPPWALRVFILVVLLGFPISLLFAWAFDVTPGGVKADSASVGNFSNFRPSATATPRGSSTMTCSPGFFSAAAIGSGNTSLRSR